MWNKLWDDHKGKLLGSTAGLFLSMIYLFRGFWDAMVVGFMIFVSYYIGRKFDKQEPFIRPQEWIQWLSERWNLFK